MIASQLQKQFPESNDRRRVLFVSVLLVAIVFAVFGRTLKYDFVNFDDETYFTANPHVDTGLSVKNTLWAFQIGYAANWHPLTWLSLMLDVRLFGPGPFGPHLTNVLLHATDAILLFLLLRRMTGTLWPSALVATLFAIHPLHVESVAWVSERKDVLSALFFMLTLHSYVRYVEPGEVKGSKRGIYYGASLLSFACGLMSKPMLVTLPCVLLLLDYWPLNRLKSSPPGSTFSTAMRLALEKIPFFLLSFGSCIVTALAQKEAITTTVILPVWMRLGNAVVSYAIYLGQTFLPINLAVFYPYPENFLTAEKFAFSLLVVAGITITAYFWRRERPYLLIGWLWYLGMLVPAIGLIQVGGQERADRYTYLPLIGIFVMIVWLVNDWFPTGTLRRKIMGIASVILIACLMEAASIQTSHWKNSESLWTHTLACTSQNYVALTDLASSLVKAGQPEAAIQDYNEAIEINPRYADAHNNLGILLARKGGTAEAIEQYRMALEINPRYPEAHINLGNSLAAQGQIKEAIDQFQEALKIDPSYGEADNDWGAVLLAQGRIAEALEHLQKAITLMPDNVEAQLNLGTALASEGHNDEAFKYFVKALQLKPGYAKAHYNLASLLAAEKRLDEAIQQYQQAVELAPAFTRAHYQLAVALQESRNPAAAAVEYQKVLELEPNHVSALNDLAWMLAACPDESLRNGNQAVELASRAEQLSHDKSPEILDTLAAAYAEAGNFAQAVQTIKKALALANVQNKKNLAAPMQSRLFLYQSNFPFRDTNLVSPAGSTKQ